MLTRRNIEPISWLTTSSGLHVPSERPGASRRPIRWTAWTVALVVGIWAGGGRLAEAACEPVPPAVIPSPASVLFPSEVLTVIWRADPACGVVETGLLMGRDPGSLRPVGQPIYGYRDRYEQSIPVQESGLYVLAAYVRDEAGRVVQSRPVPVMVVVPPPPFPDDDAHGSHGPLPFYTGTDADFLEPAGEPHFASVRSATTTYQGTWNFPDYPEVGVVAGRRVSSTHPDEVLAQQASPITGYGESVAVPRAQVQAAVDQLDESFRGFRYPRPGLYSVTCAVEVRRPGLDPDPRCAYETYYYFGTYYYGVPVAYVESASQLYDRTSQSSARSSLTYFIPAAPPGKRVASARLVAYVSGYGNLSAIRLSGKAPVQVYPFPSCAQEGSYCYMWVTWDFTEEARALAVTGGGELLLTLDPIPPKVESWPWGWVGQQSTAEWGFRVNVNYPWRHSMSQTDGLVLTFEDDCPQELRLSIPKPVVRPIFPAFIATAGPRKGQLITPIVRGAARNMPTEALVEATVKTCVAVGQTPEPIEMTFEVQAPATGTADAAGHLHGSHPRPTGLIQDIERGQATDRCTVTAFTNGKGSCAVMYRAGEVGGVETIVARAAGFADAQAQVIVRISGLENFRRFSDELWHFDGITPIHRDSHWATSFAISKVTLMAVDYYELETGTAVLRINDMSLNHGGVFDLHADWQAPHRTHRQGTSVDFNTTACVRNPDRPGAGCAAFRPIPRQRFESLCRLHGGWPENEPQYHCEFPR